MFLDGGTSIAKSPVVTRIFYAARSFSLISLIMLTSGAIRAAEPIEAAAVAPKPSLRTGSVPMEQATPLEQVLPLASGAKLITFFEPLPDNSASSTGRRDLPLLAILKDTLDDSDPGNDRIRQVWVFTYSQPSVWQRIAGGIPFLYHRAGLDRGPGTKPPRAVVDLGDPSRGVWTGLALAAVQSEVVNPVGALARLTTHSFFDNYGEYRKTHLWEASDALAALPPAKLNDVTADEMHAVEERLELAGHPLGGLVADESLPHDQEKQRTKQTETRGHNWELLRQRAEDTGLYLEPLAPAGPPASFAMLWVAQPDLEKAPTRSFDPQFLNISNPFCDDRLRHWGGYSEVWDLDPDGVPASPDSADARPVRMIPLALYALDHPHTPLLLVDFRGSGQPRRRELALKLAEDLTSGVLNLTGFGHVGYVALKASWTFIHGRHGGATNRSARRRAFVSVRNAVGSASNIDPKLRSELLGRIERVDVNPIERSWDHEVRDAWRQYDALLAYARSTQLAREVDRDRGDEMSAAVHGPVARMLLRVASIASGGLHTHHDTMNESMVAKLDQQRRDAYLKLQKLQVQSLPPVSDPLVAGRASGEPPPDSASVLAKLGVGQ